MSSPLIVDAASQRRRHATSHHHRRAATLYCRRRCPYAVKADNNNGIAVLAEKPRGAIPLSIFGEEEEEELASAHVFSNSDAVKKGSATNGSNGISDLISNLYYQRPPQMNSDKNGSISILNVAAPNPIKR